ncbi:hypothetical protein ACFP2T_18110 [Plantactinospora solaniradicis]|uniref:Uncharacterized protein n=1 Tax=Plantactinospora solaniradicis TaxID=1723736 RepID=A0ABW1K9E2_9ACTN
MTVQRPAYLSAMPQQSVVAVGFLTAPTLSGGLEPLLRPGGALGG